MNRTLALTSAGNHPRKNQTSGNPRLVEGGVMHFDNFRIILRQNNTRGKSREEKVGR